MKLKSIISFFMLIAILSCEDTKQNTTTETSETEVSTPNLSGTWELVGFYNYIDNVAVDSFAINPNFRQVKMYTDSKVMWCKHRAGYSSEWFGQGK